MQTLKEDMAEFLKKHSWQNNHIITPTIGSHNGVQSYADYSQVIGYAQADMEYYTSTRAPLPEVLIKLFKFVEESKENNVSHLK